VGDAAFKKKQHDYVVYVYAVHCANCYVLQSTFHVLNGLFQTTSISEKSTYCPKSILLHCFIPQAPSGGITGNNQPQNERNTTRVLDKETIQYTAEQSGIRGMPRRLNAFVERRMWHFVFVIFNNLLKFATTSYTIVLHRE
jgi:hypothetical protein